MSENVNLQGNILSQINRIKEGECLTFDLDFIKSVFPYNQMDIHTQNLFDCIYGKLIGSAYGTWYIEPNLQARQITIYHCFPLQVNVRISPDRIEYFRKVKHNSGLSYYLRNEEDKPDCLCSQCNDQGRYQMFLQNEPIIVNPNFAEQVYPEKVTYHSEVVQCNCIFGVAKKYHLLNINFETPF